jgi:predicted nucleotidyltransferase component of viral defense system
MISEEIIQKLAVKHQTTELNIRREYFQHIFLSWFYRQPGSEKIFFKGGTALRILYQSPRFSEDLDFSASINNAKTIEQIILNTLVEIERESIPCRLEEAKMTSGGYLAILVFGTGGMSVSLQLEISLRNKGCSGETAAIVNDFTPPYLIVHLAQKQLVTQKINALFERSKPRDFFDLYFLLRANLLTPDERELLKKVPGVLASCDIQFDRELKEFLPKSHWPVIRNFPDTISREIRRFI